MDDSPTTTKSLVKATQARGGWGPSLTFEAIWVEVQRRLGLALEGNEMILPRFAEFEPKQPATIHVFDPSIVGEASERPVASVSGGTSLKRKEAYNLRHALIPLDNFSRLLIRLDGSRDRAAIVETLVQWALTVTSISLATTVLSR